MCLSGAHARDIFLIQIVHFIRKEKSISKNTVSVGVSIEILLKFQRINRNYPIKAYTHIFRKNIYFYKYTTIGSSSHSIVKILKLLINFFKFLCNKSNLFT